MTFFREWVVFLMVFVATCPWIRGGVSDFVAPNGPVNEGRALESFLNATWPGSNFQQNETCSWNETRIKCDVPHSTVLGLNFSGIGLTGPIPAGTIANLTGLQSLDLSNNLLNGSLPDVSQITNLTKLYLRMNDFSGSLTGSEFPDSLTELDLSWNDLSGTIPPSVFNLSGLSFLSLGNNMLSGNINISAFTAKASLEILNLGNNSMQGSLPASVRSNLSVLDLHSNKFEGNVTRLVDALKLTSPNMTVLDLSSNNFSIQTFPSDFSNFERLKYLWLSANRFSSHPFPALPKGQLLNLNLSRTGLSGPIPASISDIVRLRILDLSDNALNGSLPKRLGALYQLEVLYLDRNNLSGQFPDHMDNLTFLGRLDVSYNQLSGQIPSTTQFSGFNQSDFQGNPGLCGSPLLVACTKNGTSPAGSPGGKGKSSNIGAIIAGVASGVVVIIIVVVALCIWCRVSRAVKPLAKDEPKHVSGPMQYEKDAETWALGVKDPSSITVVMFEKPLLNLTFADLVQSTGNFSKDMQLADGGYGPVYKGVLQDGTQLAIKVLVEVGFSDETKAVGKIEALAKVKHSNLVTLVGYCLVGEDTILIYEYMVNGDLQRWLHELPEGNRNPEDWSLDTWEQMEGAEISGDYLSWPTRHKIALGIARALAFLHHGCSPHVIHRDVKTSNILLDEAFDARLVDAGLAGFAMVNGTPIIGGTLGYVPPEYGQTWQATTRGDVYSFGVVLLELVTGRKPTGHYFHDSYGGNLVGWVRAMIKQDKRGQKALDPQLVSRGHVPEMLEVLRIGYLCTAETPAKRPTMQQVVGLLKDCQSGAVS